MTPRKKTARPDSGFARRLLAWHRRHGRHDLPWQTRRTPYRVWVSEIMLQQTQVTTVIPYYRRFLSRFPDVRRLAQAPLDEVLHLWSGLGYYARARNLHRTARIVCDQFRGRFPADFAAVAELPGIGRSTAGAILALSRDARYPILDGNVKRVLARFHAVRGWPGEKAVERRLWALAEAATPHARIADYTQAIMDLGATLCTRTRPRCEACPLRTDCRAHALGRVSNYPEPRPRRARPRRRTRMLVVCCGGRFLLERRPPTGVWGGLWGFPELPMRSNLDDWCRERFGSTPQSVRRGFAFRHAFSHFDLDIEPVYLELAPRTAGVEEGPEVKWCDARRLPRLGLAAPVRKLIQAMQHTGEAEDDADGPMRLAG